MCDQVGGGRERITARGGLRKHARVFKNCMMAFTCLRVYIPALDVMNAVLRDGYRRGNTKGMIQLMRIHSTDKHAVLTNRLKA